MKREEQSFREVCTVQHGLTKEMQDAEDDVYKAEATEAGHQHQELMTRERKKNCQVARIPGLAAEEESSGVEIQENRRR